MNVSQVNQCWFSSWMARCKSLEVILHEPSGFSNTRSHCVPDRMERASEKEMEVGGRKKRILGESKKDKKRSALLRETISSVFVTGAKTVQSRH